MIGPERTGIYSPNDMRVFRPSFSGSGYWVEFNERWFKTRCMTWRAMYARAYWQEAFLAKA
jgi:hypothetical protein